LPRQPSAAAILVAIGKLDRRIAGPKDCGDVVWRLRACRRPFIAKVFHIHRV